MYKVSEEDHKRIISQLSLINLEKIKLCDFLRFVDQKSADIKVAYEQALADLNEQKEKLKSKLEEDEKDFRTLYDMILKSSVPEDADKTKLEYNDRERAFVERTQPCHLSPMPKEDGCSGQQTKG